MSLAGYEARGLELSPKLARDASVRFGVEILTGSIDRQNVPAGSLDVIALFDVLEHLQEPLQTLRHCRRLLKSDGIVVIQTPRYPESRTFEEMASNNDAFLAQLKPAEHLYLFSNSSIKNLLNQAGFPCVWFEAAIFGQYDMFLFASVGPLKRLDQTEANAALLRRPLGRFAQALIDCHDAYLTSHSSSEDLKNERNLLQAQLADLQKNFDATEADRLERGKVIEHQGNQLSALQVEFDSRLKELTGLHTTANALKNECNLLQAQLADLQKNFEATETDRLERGKVIAELGGRVDELQRLVWLTEQNRNFWKEQSPPNTSSTQPGSD